LVALAILLSTTAIIAAAADTITVTLTADGETRTVQTRAKDPADILAEAGIESRMGDFIDDSAFTRDSSSVITLYRIAVVKIFDGKKETLAAIAGTVGKALADGGFTLREEDCLTPAPETPLTDGMEIKITRAFKVEVTADGETRELWLSGGTVSEALTQAGVTYKKNDEITPRLDKKLTNATEITVGRVTYKTRVAQEEVPFASSTRNSNDLYVGESKISQKGRNGLNEVTYKDRYVDGELAGVSKKKTVELKKPVEQIKLLGAVSPVYKPVIMKTGLRPISVLQPSKKLELDKNGIPKNYKQVVTGLAKSYSIGSYGASGGRCVPGTIAVDPKQFPYGTEMYIVSTDGKFLYGYAVANDTGGFVKTNSCMVDLYMPSMDACIQWGARNVRIYVL